MLGEHKEGENMHDYIILHPHGHLVSHPHMIPHPHLVSHPHVHSVFQHEVEKAKHEVLFGSGKYEEAKKKALFG